MAHRTISSGPSDSLRLPWSWCARCQRAYPTGTGRVIRFRADALHPHPAMLTLCPYLDCSASTLRDGWRWATIQGEHPDYPPQPERNVVYVRDGKDSSQAHGGSKPQCVGAGGRTSERQALAQEADSMPTTPNVLSSAPVGQEGAALKDELARAFRRMTLERRRLARWEDDGGTVAATAERVPQ